MVGFWQAVGASSVVISVLLAIMLAIYYFVSYRNIKERKVHFQKLHQSLAPGQRVEFANGLIGKIKSVGDEVCLIEIKSGATIEVSRFAISRRIDG